MSNSKKPKDIGKLLQELEEVVTWFESDQVDLALAVKKYEQGLTTVKELEKLLSQAKLEIEHIDKSFDS